MNKQPSTDTLWLLPRGHARLWAAGFVVVAIFCALSYIFFDLKIAIFVRENMPADAVHVFYLITDAGLGGPWLGLSAALMMIGYIGARRATSEQGRQRFYRLRDSFAFMFVAQTFSGVFVVTAKVIIGRIRPKFFFNDGLYGFHPFNFDFGMNSFPSGHSQTAWASMIALALLFPRFRPYFIIAAIIISGSRVMVSAHYLSDVVMGSYVGAIMTVMTWMWFQKRNLQIGYT